MRTVFVAVTACLVLAGTMGGAIAGSEGLVMEPAYYQGQEVGLLVPSGNSENPNQVIGGGGCFSLGPDMSKTGRAKAATLYALFVPGATQYGCPDGSRTHDHVIGVAPGDPGYSAAWHVIVATPGPNFDVSDMPYTSVDEVLTGVTAGELVLSDTGFEFRAPVVGVS
jgi:hypothetical protein